MDVQEVGATTGAGAAAQPADAPLKPAQPWTRRGILFYITCGLVFVLGFAALMLVIRGELALAGRALLLAMVFAGVEYNFTLPSQGQMSREDEFAAFTDLLTFSVVPGFLMFRLCFENWGVLGLGGLFVIIFAGVLRLSLYKIYNHNYPRDGWVGFIGVPCALSTVFIALLPQLVTPGMLTPIYRLGLLMACIGLAFLTVSTFRYPNPMKSPWVLALLGVAVGCVFYGAPVQLPAIYALLISGALYILLAPLGARGRR